MSRYRPLGLEDRMPFGKYKDMKLRVLMFENISYLQWLIDSNKDFELDDQAYAEYERRLDQLP